MELIRGLHNLRPRHLGCVATIGNFDGVHLGHQAVFKQLMQASSELGVPSTVVTFEPQPQEFFAPERAPARLTRLREKVSALRQFAIDRMLCLRFNQRAAAVSAEQFIQQVLVDGLRVRYLVVGDDFRFGHGRSGDFVMLRRAGEALGFEVDSLRTFAVDGQRVSSTRIREALASGDLAAAEQFLGRPYRMCGRVAHGAKRGRSIGFPTANLHLHRNKTPVNGVFAVRMTGVAGEPLSGVANVGSRPTVDGVRTLLEVHLFDFDADIYGRYVQVDFVHKIRDERRFDSFDELKRQIQRDAEQARDVFARQAKIRADLSDGSASKS